MRKIKGKFIIIALTSLLLLSSLIVLVIACADPAPAPGWIYLNPADTVDPVYLKNGEYHLSVEDVLIWGRVMPVQIIRTYGNREGAKPGLGHGWDLNYNLKVVERGSNKIILHDGEHRELEYTKLPGLSIYTAPPGLYDYIEKKSYGTYVLHKKHGTRLHFSSDGKLSMIENRHHSNYIAFGYTNGLLTTIYDDMARAITLTYNSNDLLETITDSEDRAWTYGYDSNRDLRSVTTPATEEHPSGLTTTYTYDEYHNLLTATDPENQPYLTNQYDADDGATFQAYGTGLSRIDRSPSTNSGTVTDRKSVETEFVYNITGNPISVTIYTENLRPDDPPSYTTQYAYNSDMEITRKTLPAGNCIDYTYDPYDPNGNITGLYRKTSPSDPQDPDHANVIGMTCEYEKKYNFVKTITDPRGYVTTCTYDYEETSYGTTAGNLMKITFPAVPVYGEEDPINPVVSFTYNTRGKLITVTAPDGIVTKFEYHSSDQLYRLKKIIRDFGTSNETSEFTYDDLGNVATVKDPVGNITELTHNNLDQLTQINSALEYLTKFSYNKNKKLSKIQAQLGETFDSATAQTTEFTYEILDHLETITNPLGKDTEFSYDDSENLSQIMDAEYNSTLYDHDERNLLWKVQDAASAVTEYSYDDNGNLRKIEDDKGQITEYDYDDFDRLETITYHDDTTEVLGYDKSSNVTSYKNRNSEEDTITCVYDALNRLTSQTWPDSRVTTYEYDIAGRLVYVGDTGGRGGTKYEYDRLGRVEEVTQRDNTPGQKTIKYEYDGMGRRTKLIYPDSSYITYHYDELSRLTDIKDHGYTELATYTYDQLSRRTLVTYLNNTNAVYDYEDKVETSNDNFGNVLENLTNNFSSSVTKIFDYTYDDAGNRLTMTVDDEDTHYYYYDDVYQLTNVYYPDSDYVTYNYDKLGNRTSVVQGGTTTYTLNGEGLNQYGTVGWNTYSYDDNGNLISGVNTETEYEFDYDYENHLTEARIDTDTVGKYTYDFADRRITKTADSTSTHYYYDGDQVIAEYEGTTLVRKFIYGPAIDEPIMMIDVEGGNAKYYYHYDALGSVVALSNSSGIIVETYSYDVFGGPSSTGSVGNPYFFTGRRLDAETGLYYYRTRYYSKVLGRFLQTDPIGYYCSMNLYDYCWNNPVNWIDPWGLAWYHKRWIASIMGVVGDSADYQYKTIDNIPARVTGLVMGVDFTPSQSKELNTGFSEGITAGTIIAGDAYTFGWIPPLNAAASEKVCEYGWGGEWSKRLAWGSRELAFTAGTMWATGPKGPLFGRGRFRGGNPGIFNGGNTRLGWGHHESRHMFGLHGGVPYTRTHWHHDWFSLSQRTAEFIYGPLF